MVCFYWNDEGEKAVYGHNPVDEVGMGQHAIARLDKQQDVNVSRPKEPDMHNLYKLGLLWIFSLLLAACQRQSLPTAAVPTTTVVVVIEASTAIPTAMIEASPTPTRISPIATATPVVHESPAAPTAAPTVTAAATATAIIPGDALRIAHDEATLTSPAPPGTVVVFPGGLELVIIDVLYPATVFLIDEVGGDDLQRRVTAEATGNRSPLVVEWMAACPATTTALPATTPCGALLSATVDDQPLVDLAAYTAYDPRFPQVLGLPYGVPAGEARRSFIVSTSIPSDETPALLEVVYYLSDPTFIEYATAVFDLGIVP